MTLSLGMPALRRKSLAMTDLFIALVESRCAGHGLELVTPRSPARRGSQASLTWTGEAAPGGGSAAHAIVQALIARGVIGDFRAGEPSAGTSHAGSPDILRFGFTPLYGGFEDVWNAVDHLRAVLDGGEWRQPRFHQQHAVT